MTHTLMPGRSIYPTTSLPAVSAGAARAPHVVLWRQRICAADGPSNYTLRLVLLALSVLMEAEGKSAVRVTFAEIARATRLSRSWIAVVLKEAVEQGWLIQGKRLWRGPKKGGTACLFTAAIPEVPHGTSDLDHAEAHA